MMEMETDELLEPMLAKAEEALRGRTVGPGMVKAAGLLYAARLVLEREALGEPRAGDMAAQIAAMLRLLGARA